VGNKALISDVGCAALFCRAALESAAMNIYINTLTLKGDAQAEEFNREVKEIIDEYVPRVVAVSDAIMLQLSTR